MRNIELLEKTMQFIKDNPEKHDQHTWCGTAQCFAGWAVHLQGGRVVDEESAIVEVGWHRDHVQDVAESLLGLDGWESGALFAGGNTLEELELMVKDLVNGDELG